MKHRLRDAIYQTPLITENQKKRNIRHDGKKKENLFLVFGLNWSGGRLEALQSDTSMTDLTTTINLFLIERVSVHRIIYKNIVKCLQHFVALRKKKK